MVAKLDTVAGTRALCNFFENGVAEVEAKERAAAQAKAAQAKAKQELTDPEVSDKGSAPLEAVKE